MRKLDLTYVFLTLWFLGMFMVAFGETLPIMIVGIIIAVISWKAGKRYERNLHKRYD